jgi:hypothetical protein
MTLWYGKDDIAPVLMGERGSVVGWSTVLKDFKFAGSIPDEVIGFFNLPNPSSRNMTLGLTHPVTESSTTNLPGDKVRLARKANNSLSSVRKLSWNDGSLDTSQPNGRWPPLWSSGQSSWLQIRRPGFDSRHYQKKKRWVWSGVHSASWVQLRSYLIEK